jgi:hypothetical protein
MVHVIKSFVQCNWNVQLCFHFCLYRLRLAGKEPCMQKRWGRFIRRCDIFAVVLFGCRDLGTRDSDVFQSWRALGFAQRLSSCQQRCRGGYGSFVPELDFSSTQPTKKRKKHTTPRFKASIQRYGQLSTRLYSDKPSDHKVLGMKTKKHCEKYSTPDNQPLAEMTLQDMKVM